MNVPVASPDAITHRTTAYTRRRCPALPAPRYVHTALLTWRAHTPLPLPPGDAAGWTSLLSYFGLGALWLPRVKGAAALRAVLRCLHAAMGAPHPKLSLPALLALPVPAGQIVAALCALARKGAPKVRATALLLCVLREVPDVEALLLAALRERKRVVREAAIVALGHGYTGPVTPALVEALAQAVARATNDRQRVVGLDTIDRLDVWGDALPTLRQDAGGELKTFLDAMYEAVSEGEASSLRAWLAHPDASLALAAFRFLRHRPGLLAECASALEHRWSQAGRAPDPRRDRMDAVRFQASLHLAALRSHMASPGDGWQAEVEALLAGNPNAQRLGCAAVAQSPELARAVLPRTRAVMRASLPSELVCEAALAVLAGEPDDAEAARVLYGAARPDTEALRRAARAPGPAGAVFAQLVGLRPADAALVALAGAATHPRIARAARLGLSLVAPDTVVPALVHVASSREMSGPARRNAAACALLADHDVREGALTHRLLLLRGERLPGESRAPMAASLAALVGFDAQVAPHALTLLEGLDTPELAPVAPVLRAVMETTGDACLRARIRTLLGATWTPPTAHDALAAAMGCPAAHDAANGRVGVSAETPAAVRDALRWLYGAALYGDDGGRAREAHRNLAALDVDALRGELGPALRARLADRDEDCQRAALRVLAGLADAPWTAEERAAWIAAMRGLRSARGLRGEVAEALRAWGGAPLRRGGVSPAVRRYLRQLEAVSRPGGAAGSDDDDSDDDSDDDDSDDDDGPGSNGGGNGGSNGGGGPGRVPPRHLIRF